MSRDTVDSVGLIPKRLPFTTSNTIVRTFRHAVALDERRAKFKANLWNRPTSDEEQLGLQATTNQPLRGSPIPFIDSLRKDGTKSSRNKEEEDERRLSNYEKMYSEKETRPTDIEEVWFSVRPSTCFVNEICLCHNVLAGLSLWYVPSLTTTTLSRSLFRVDVGGGSVNNKTRNSLARISLRWMVRECFKTNTGMMFHSHRLRDIGLDPTTLFPFVTPRPSPLPVGSATVAKVTTPSRFKRIFSRVNKEPASGIVASSSASTSSTEKKADISISIRTEEEEDLYDAMSPVYDQLCLKRAWWILELIPLNLRYQRGDNQWVDYIGLVVHISVISI